MDFFIEIILNVLYYCIKHVIQWGDVMDWTFDNNIPIYVQLVEQLKVSIISGELKPGDRLLSVREFAFNMKVNPNTMQKALSELEDLKLIYIERTNGKYVTEDKKLIAKLKKEYAEQVSEKYLENMKNLGFSIDEVLEFLKTKGGDK